MADLGNSRVFGFLSVLKDLTVKGIVYCQDWTTTSDERKKTHIKPIGPVLEDMAQVTGISYRMTDDVTQQQRFGFSAQNMATVYPGLLRTDSDGYYSLNYGDAVGIVWNGVVETHSFSLETRSEVDALKERVADLERLVAKLTTS